MKLEQPVIITPRLLPGVQIGGSFISIEFAGAQSGRAVCRYYIDIPDFQEYSANDLRSGRGGADLQTMLATLLSFLSAAGESYRYLMGGADFPASLSDPDNNASMFPPYVSEWAYMNSDELGLLALELEEHNLISE